MNENPILPARIFFFFPPLFYPKIFPRPTYHLPTPPPSLHQPELLAPETLSESELGAWSRLGAGASLELGGWNELGVAGAGPTQDPGKHFSLCCFFFVLQEKKNKKKAMASPSSSSLCCGTAATLQRHSMVRSGCSVATQAPKLLHSWSSVAQLHETLNRKP